jgi:hypothetical protein|tara:strand:- start:168 stop:440 length:273 start_codon:yes stop_codon:yes gene_type:complete
MGVFKDLLVYKRKRLYNITKHRKDVNLNVRYDYKKNGLLDKQMSPHIRRNQTMREFLIFVNDYFLSLLDQVRSLKNFGNFTIEKDDERTR